jgi:predicted ArsR family transcriptional regulator
MHRLAWKEGQRPKHLVPTNKRNFGTQEARDRAVRILAFLKESGGAYSMDVIELLRDVNKHSVRSQLSYMETEGMVQSVRCRHKGRSVLWYSLP